MTIHFSSSILKIDKDGNEVLSSTLDKGEKLANGTKYAELAKETGVLPEEAASAKVADEAAKAAKDAENLSAGTMTLDETKTSTQPETTGEPTNPAESKKAAEDKAAAESKPAAKTTTKK